MNVDLDIMTNLGHLYVSAMVIHSDIIILLLPSSTGTLSYYSISETMTLLHRVQTMFTQPLYPGFWLPLSTGGTAELCELKQTGSVVLYSIC